MHHQEWNSIEIMPSCNLNIHFVYNKLLSSIRDNQIFQYQCASTLTFISLSYTIYMPHGIKHIKYHDIHL
jgi:hypothetical protein